MLKDDCPRCKIPLVPEIGEDKSFHNIYSCPRCRTRYAEPYKGSLLKIGPANARPIFLFHFSCPVILIKLFQFCANNCFAGFSTYST